ERADIAGRKPRGAPALREPGVLPPDLHRVAEPFLLQRAHAVRRPTKHGLVPDIGRRILGVERVPVERFAIERKRRLQHEFGRYASVTIFEVSGTLSTMPRVTSDCLITSIAFGLNFPSDENIGITSSYSRACTSRS